MDIKEQLYRIAEKHLAVEYFITEQTEGWTAVEAEVRHTVLNYGNICLSIIYLFGSLYQHYRIFLIVKAPRTL